MEGVDVQAEMADPARVDPSDRRPRRPRPVRRVGLPVGQRLDWVVHSCGRSLKVTFTRARVSLSRLGVSGAGRSRRFPTIRRGWSASDLWARSAPRMSRGLCHEVVSHRGWYCASSRRVRHPRRQGGSPRAAARRSEEPRSRAARTPARSTQHVGGSELAADDDPLAIGVDTRTVEDGISGEAPGEPARSSSPLELIPVVSTRDRPSSERGDVVGGRSNRVHEPAVMNDKIPAAVDVRAHGERPAVGTGDRALAARRVGPAGASIGRRRCARRRP